MSSPWLSVLVPVHGVAAYLDACVASLVQQAGDGVELLFVDDASRDGEDAMLAAWQARYPDRIRIVTHPANRGIASTRNTLLDGARGDYLWFVDSDDLMLPGAVAALREVVVRHQPDIVLCDFRVLREDDATAPARKRRQAREAHVPGFLGTTDVLSRSPDQLLAGLFGAGRMYAWSKIVRRAAWPAALRFPEQRLFEDLAVYPRLALAMRSFIHVPQVWIGYRQRSGSIVASTTPKKLDDWLFAMAGFGAELRGAGAAISSATLFAVADFCTREWRNGVRAHGRLPAAADQREALARFRDYWLASSPLSVPELTGAYLRRGQFRRCWQMRSLLSASLELSSTAPL